MRTTAMRLLVVLVLALAGCGSQGDDGAEVREIETGGSESGTGGSGSGSVTGSGTGSGSVTGSGTGSGSATGSAPATEPGSAP